MQIKKIQKVCQNQAFAHRQSFKPQYLRTSSNFEAQGLIDVKTKQALEKFSI